MKYHPTPPPAPPSRAVDPPDDGDVDYYFDVFDPEEREQAQADDRDYRKTTRQYETLLDYVRSVYFDLDTCTDRAWRIRCTESIEELFDTLHEDL